MEFLELLHLILENIVDGAILLFEFIGVGIIIFSGIRGFWNYCAQGGADVFNSLGN